MRILWDNKTISATLTVETEDANYPATNMQDTRLSRVYRSTDDENQAIIINDTSYISVSYVAIFNHNITSTATIRLEACNDTDSNDNADWVNPDFSTTIPWTEYYLIKNITEANYDQWRIFIDDPLNPDGYIQIGLVYIGTYLQMPGMKIDQEVPNATESISKVSYGGQLYGDENYDYRPPIINFPTITQAQRLSIKAMWAGRKNTKPIILLIWANELDFESPIYCFIDQKKITFKRTDSPNLQWQTTIKFRETY